MYARVASLETSDTHRVARNEDIVNAKTPLYKRRGVRLGLTGALLFSGAVGATYSAFSDTAHGEISVSTGSIDIKLDGSDTTASAPYALALDNLAPGDVVVRTVDLSSSSSLPVTVSFGNVTAAQPGGLADQITVRATVDGAVAYTGALSGFTIAGSSANNLEFDAAGAGVDTDRAIELTFTVPDLSDTWQTSSDSISFDVTAVKTATP